MITFSGNRRGMDDRVGADNCVAFLNKVKAQAEDKGVTICMEYLNSKVNHKDYMFDHIAWGVDVMKRVNSPRVKILFDIYHAQIMDGDIVRNIRDNFQHIAHFHTGGNPGRHDIDDTQELNYRFIAQAIADLGFTGFVSHEYSPRPRARPNRYSQQGNRDMRRLESLTKGTGLSVPCRKLLTSSHNVGVDRVACPLFWQPSCPVRALWGQAGPYVRQEVDPAAAARGKRVYTQFCINCHGAAAKGTEQGPDLIRSPLVLRDRLGDQIGPALKKLANHKARSDKGASCRSHAFPQRPDRGDGEGSQSRTSAECAHGQCGSRPGILQRRRQVQYVSFTHGRSRRCRAQVRPDRVCSSDFCFRARSKPIQVTVTPSGGQSVTGSLERIDDFSVSLRDAAGEYRTFSRDKDVKVDISDPLAAHNQMLDAYTDQDMHNVVRYLESLK